MSSFFTPMPAKFCRNHLPCCTVKSVALFLIFLFFLLFFATENASATSHCNIDDTDRLAWSESLGWIDFKPEPINCVTVLDDKLIGYAWSDFAGWISMNCENDGDCDPWYGVVNDTNGNLSGLAWSESLGWIDFAPPTYPPVIIRPNGEFEGYAWGENFGWISFNCNQPGGGNTCSGPGGVDYKVKTTWVPNKPPNKPNNIAPDDGVPPDNASILPTLTGTLPLLKASAFVDPNLPLDAHQQTKWQLSTDPAQDGTSGDFTAPITINDPDAKTEHQITTAGVLEYGTRYYWHVQYQDSTGLWSLWSDMWSFTTPLEQPQNVVGYPDNDLQNPATEQEYPFTITWKWNPVFKYDNGAQTDAAFFLYLDDMSDSFDCDPIEQGQQDYCFIGTTNINGSITINSYNGKSLSSNTQYKAIVVARDPDFPAEYSNSFQSPPSAPEFLAIDCTNGVECRKGELCVDHDGSGATSKICANFDNCANGFNVPSTSVEGNACYVSACDRGNDCYVSPAGRDFTVPGKCTVAATKTCDLPAIKPHTPFVCKNNGNACQSNAALASGVPYLAMFKWKNSDPNEGPFDDYRNIAFTYTGEDASYTITIVSTETKTDTFSGLAAETEKSYTLSSPDFLDFNSVDTGAPFKWRVTATATGDSPVVSQDFSFNTESICPYIFHDYEPRMYIDETLYTPPGDSQDNPNVIYPSDVTVKWSFDPNLTVGAVAGPGTDNKPKFVLHVQEYSIDDADWVAFDGPNGTVPTCGSWGCINNVDTDTQFRFGGPGDNCADDPSTCLDMGKQYRWYLEVIHGHNPSFPITTQCDNDNVAHDLDIHYFLSETTPGIALSKKLISIRGSELTYQIDFSFTGAPWGRIKNVEIRDNYPNSPSTDFFDTQNSVWTDDVLTVKEPSTLKITRLCRASSGDHDTALIWGIGDSADPNCASVDLNDCTVSTSCSVSTNSRGSLILVMNEQDTEPIPQCTVLENKATARGQALNGKILTALSNPVSHLGGSGQTDLGFLATQRGDIHSNADICFKNAPDIGYYVGDYFVTAKGTVPSTVVPRAQEQFVGSQYVISDNPILELDRNPGAPDFAKIDYTDVYAEVAKTGGVEKRGECSAKNIFGDELATPVITLGGKVYSCRSDSTGATDYNNDGVTINGDFIVDREMEIDKNGKAGTIVVDGNLYIEADIFYEAGAPSAVKDVASLGWIVRGSVYIKEYRIDAVDDCDPTSRRPNKWCDTYHVLDDGDDNVLYTLDDVLKYPSITLGPNKIAGTFFAEQKIFTGKINNPLTIDGSLIADEVVLERRAVEDGGGSAPVPNSGVIEANNRFAYGELVGWIDMKPAGGGVYVYNNYLAGFAYGELIGWISMRPPGGGVLNNGSGVLSGHAYSDLGGWIRFDPPGGGVTINPSTGEFSGDAYGELVGWIRFNGSGYGVVTTWRGQ